MLPQAVLAPAKLNLRLKIEGLREDNYHLLSMLNVTCDLCDYLQLEFIDLPSFTVNLQPDSFGMLPWLRAKREIVRQDFENPEKNLATRAAKALFAALNLKGGVNIKISKAIPFGAGLGGGSSDAAAVLRAITNRYFLEMAPHSYRDKNEITELVVKIAEEIGADVKFLLSGGVASVKGIGELINPISMPGMQRLGVILLFPELGTSTKEVFLKSRNILDKNIHNSDNVLDSWLSNLQLHNESSKNEFSYRNLLSIIENDLQPAACQILPLLKEVFECLKGVDGVVTSLSGSGSTVMVFSKTAWSPDREVYQAVLRAVSQLPVEVRMTHFYDIRPIFTC